jgi:hypothetical protein
MKNMSYNNSPTGYGSSSGGVKIRGYASLNNSYSLFNSPSGYRVENNSLPPGCCGKGCCAAGRRMRGWE